MDDTLRKFLFCRRARLSREIISDFLTLSHKSTGDGLLKPCLQGKLELGETSCLFNRHSFTQLLPYNHHYFI